MTRAHEPLDQLIREALGEPANPAPARRASRAALQLVLAEARQRARRRQAGLALAAGLALVFGMAGPLGSDDFGKSVEVYFRNGHEIRKYKLGLRGDVIGTYGPDDPLGFKESEVDHIYQELASGQVEPIELYGWQVGRDKHFYALADVWSGEKWSTNELAADGYSKDFPPWLDNLFHTMPTLARQVDEIAESRPPDFTTTMRSNGLDWIVSGWHIELPGLTGLVYYSGLRADGVRGR